MGKTQSKRSVDITTDGKKGPEEEVTGKLEKIDDPDQKQVNGDATPQENVEAEKKDADETENDKDLTTEKSAEAGQGGGDSVEQNITATAAEGPKGEESATAKEGEKMAGAGGTEEISPLADENSKKPKKEKVKKKWSFRSISFGKKDKQKPAKSEEAATENTGPINGEAETTTEKSAVEGATDTVKKDEAVENAEAENPTEKLENGEASEKELNGQKTPTSTPTEEKSNEAGITENTTKRTGTTDSNETTANEINQIEKKAESVDVSAASDASPVVVSNGAAAEKNGVDASSPVDEIKTLMTDKTANLMEAAVAVVDKIKSIPSVVNDGCEVAPHQNGTSADGEAVESETQIEVNTQTTRTPTENLASSTSSVPYTLSLSSIPLDRNAQLQQSNINVSSNENENSTDASATTVGSGGVETAKSEFILTVAAPIEPPNQKQREENCQAVSAIQTDIQEPPPLPISPPPSQVSVFAFNEHQHSPVGETVADEQPLTKVILPSDVEFESHATSTIFPTAATINEGDRNKIPTVLLSADTDIKQTDIDDNGEITEVVKMLENVQIKQEIRGAGEERSQEPEPAAAIEISTAVILNDEMKNGADRLPQNVSYKSEEFVVAETMVADVTQKAVEIVQQQIEKLKQPSGKTVTIAVEDVVVCKSEEKDTNIIQSQGLDSSGSTLPIDVTTPTAAETIGLLPDNAGTEENVISASVSVVSESELNASTAIDPSHDAIEERDHEKNEGNKEMREEEDCSMLCPKEIEKLTVSNNDDDRGGNDDGSISPSKEIENAKDLKENAAVEITTQDLPVTCE